MRRALSTADDCLPLTRHREARCDCWLEDEMRARLVQLGSGAPMTEARPFRVGDYVTRDGSDVHRVLSLNEDAQAGEFECVVAPSKGWISVGETEYNITGRYELVAPPVLPMTEARARELIDVADWHGFGWSGHHTDDMRDGVSRIQLDGHYTADELEAFAWWLRNKPEEEPR